MKHAAWILSLAVTAGCASTAPPPVEPTRTPTATERPAPFEPAAPTPTPTPGPEGPPPGRPESPASDTLIRVLLDRLDEEITLPQPGRTYLVRAEGEERWMWGPLRVDVGDDPVYQIGAWSSSDNAVAVERSLASALGPSATVWREETGTGLIRVRVRWSGDPPADPVALLAAAGFDGAMRVASGGSVRLTGRGGSVRSAAAIVVTPGDPWPVVVGSKSYRGRFRVRPTPGGALLINELPMEDYLRGVVPSEMGPYQFPELEALKAQTIAARTYAVAHLGDHDDEGWDICDTPACQVYNGVGAEHSLTDRAIRETAGLIAVFDGAPIDAMYTSTCGGHTEDASELFDGRGAPYLVGVECAWDRPSVLAGAPPPPDVTDEPSLRQWLARRALGLDGGGVEPRLLIARVADACGGRIRPLPADPSLALWVEALSEAGGLDPSNPLVSGEGAGRLVRLADRFGVPLRPAASETLRDGWMLEAAAAVLELNGLMVHDRGEAVPHPDGVAIYPRRADGSEPLPPGAPLIWRWGSSYGGATAARVLPGTTLERYRAGDEVLAVVVVRSGGGSDADRRSAWRSWRRERSWDELAARLGEPGLAGLEVARRGRSGRVVTLAVIGADGTRRLIEGFAIRRALDLPETLFEMHVTTAPDGSRVARFLGGGWGHGVGLCQNGAYGLARAGMTFDRILEHYYTGIEVVPWRGRVGSVE